jgi:hypothetical protein
MDRAFAKSGIDEPPAQTAPTAAPVAQVAPAAPETSRDDGRDAQGRFAPKAPELAPPPADAKPIDPAKVPAVQDAPARLSPAAKAEWAKVPIPVQQEVSRAIAEAEKGISDYQARFEPLKPFFEMAAREGTTVQDALSNHVRLAQQLRTDPVKGIEEVLAFAGMTPQQYAAHVAGLPPPAPEASQQTIAALQQELQQLRGQLGQFEQQNEQSLAAQVQDFAAKAPRFEELRDTMAGLFNAGLAQDLETAYNMAAQLKPGAPQPEVKTPATPAPAQTNRANLSVIGAPSSGSNPASRKPSASPRDSINRAFAAAGLG